MLSPVRFGAPVARSVPWTLTLLAVSRKLTSAPEPADRPGVGDPGQSGSVRRSVVSTSRGPVQKQLTACRHSVSSVSSVSLVSSVSSAALLRSGPAPLRVCSTGSAIPGRWSQSVVVSQRVCRSFGSEQLLPGGHRTPVCAQAHSVAGTGPLTHQLMDQAHRESTYTHRVLRESRKVQESPGKSPIRRVLAQLKRCHKSSRLREVENGVSENAMATQRQTENAALALHVSPCVPLCLCSSNILLDCHLVAKLADFGLARFACRAPSGRSAAQTVSVGKTATVRGTLAYLPDEYVRNGELGTAVDVFSFGVVLLEVLTGRRALEKDRKSGDRYLKDLVEEVEDGPGGSCAAVWRKHVDQRLISGGAVEPAGCLEAVALACRCLDRKRKKRPSMTEVFDKLQDIHIIVRRTSSSSSPLHHLQPPSLSLPRPPPPLDSTVGALSDQLSKLGPLEDTYQPSPSSQLSSLCSFTPPHPLHSCASLPSSSSSSLAGPCETDESRGFSQYDLRSQCRFNGTSSRCLSPSSRDHSAAVPPECQLSQPSVPTEDQYSFSLQPSTPSELTGGPSPGGSLQAASPGPSVHMNPSKLRFLQKKRLYEDGQIQTPELLSSDDLYGGRSSVRGPEESDELDYLHHY
ncbi:interleukin-1 receptor-associated kinase 1 [Plectropomus leopardus]|uniref:interleukin-1 receptor-associated kinase 1 n=1 Tax=Plectropomus leopardus TaxID=160734 RepID=UPI001C4C6284|nr:interleukin-1 receptor-associated kinase 1 [Plectropomus leopardus]